MLNEEIIKWCREEWPKRTLESVERKLLEETQELRDAIHKKDELNTKEELFDAYAMIVDYCFMHNIDLQKLFEAKKEIIEHRKLWGKMPNQEKEILRRYL